MKDSIARRLDRLVERHEEISALLADPATIGDQKQFRELSQEYAEIEPVVEQYQKYRRVQEDLADAQALMRDGDPDMRAMAEDEVSASEARLTELDAELQRLMLPKDPNENNNAYLEIRAGAGGDEAALFAGDLFRMYGRYAENRGWRVSVLSQSEGEHGGYKELIALVEGSGVYGRLRFESGGHRVQRVPETESQGRIHTSACTVAVMPEVDAPDEINIDKNDLRVDTFRSSGAGGQQRQHHGFGHPHHPYSHGPGGGMPTGTLPAQEPRGVPWPSCSPGLSRRSGTGWRPKRRIPVATWWVVAIVPNASAPIISPGPGHGPPHQPDALSA